jgi:hypothetical protein
MKIRRNTYAFNHPSAGSEKIIKARSERKAWKKMRSFVVGMMYGNWALVYDQGAVDEIMEQVTCREVP